MSDQVDLRRLRDIIAEHFGPRVQFLSVSRERGQITFVLYEAFAFTCEIEPPHNNFGMVLHVAEHSSIKTLLGRRPSLNSDERSIRESLNLADEYCLLRLPDKYLDAYSVSHSS